jgi:hypothetical protein
LPDVVRVSSQEILPNLPHSSFSKSEISCLPPASRITVSMLLRASSVPSVPQQRDAVGFPADADKWLAVLSLSDGVETRDRSSTIDLTAASESACSA